MTLRAQYATVPPPLTVAVVQRPSVCLALGTPEVQCAPLGGTFLVAAGNCIPCPQAARCAGDMTTPETLSVRPGYRRTTTYAVADVDFYVCPFRRSACVGGPGLGHCAIGYDEASVGCAGCAAGFAGGGAHAPCVHCGPTVLQALWGLLGLAVLLAVGALMVWEGVWQTTRAHPQGCELTPSEGDCLMHGAAPAEGGPSAEHLRALHLPIKQLVTFLQTSWICAGVTVQWPSPLGFVVGLGASAAVPLASPHWGCVFGSGAAMQLYAGLGLALGAGVAYTAARAILSRGRAQTPAPEAAEFSRFTAIGVHSSESLLNEDEQNLTVFEASPADALYTPHDVCDAAAGAATLLLYPTVVGAAASFSTCRRILGDAVPRGPAYLTADFAIECGTASHRVLQSLGSFVLLFIGLGVPAAAAALAAVVQHKAHARDGLRPQVRAALLLRNYRPTAWYWEGVVTLRKFLLLVVVRQSATGAVQAAWMAAVLLLELLLFVHVRPYHRFSQTSELLALMANLLMLGLAGLFGEDGVQDSMARACVAGALVIVYVGVVSVLLLFGVGVVASSMVGVARTAPAAHWLMRVSASVEHALSG